MLIRFYLKLTLLIFVFTSFTVLSAEEQEYKNVQVPLMLVSKKVKAQKILDIKINHILEWKDKLFLIGDRDLYLYDNNQIINLKNKINLPKSIDWFNNAIIYKDQLVLSAGQYSVSQKLEDDNAKLGGFKAGPLSKGIIVISLNDYTSFLIESFKVNNFKQYQETYEVVGLPEKISINPQQYAVDPISGNLMVTDFGLIATIDLTAREANVILFENMAASRQSILVDSPYLWYTANEGGADGSWIEKFINGKEINRYYPMNENYIYPDSIVKYSSKIFISTLAGLIQINEKEKVYNQYVFIKNDKKKAIFSLSLINNKIVALSDQGWLIFDLENKKVNQYSLDNEKSNEIYSFYSFKGKHFVSNKEALFLF